MLHYTGWKDACALKQFMACWTRSAVLIILLASTFPGLASADSAEPAGEIKFTVGEAYIFHQGERKKAVVNMPVYAGDTALTRDDGRIKLHMIDDSLVYIAHGSRVIIKEYRAGKSGVSRGTFDMLWGKVRFMVNKLTGDATFQTRTKTAIMGVRGTQYIVITPLAMLEMNRPVSIFDDPDLTLDDVQEAITRLIVLEGQVRGMNNSGDSRDVNAGNTANFYVNGVIKVKPTESIDGENMPTAGVTATDAGSKPSHATFKKSVPGPAPGGLPNLPPPNSNMGGAQTNSFIAGATAGASSQSITQTVTQATVQGATTITIAPTFVP